MNPTARLSRAALILLAVLIGGTVAYRVVEGAGWFDSLYMVLITVSTVGYAEVFELSEAGRVVTSVLIVSGVGTALYTGVAALEVGIEQVSARGRKARMQREIDHLVGHQIVCGYGRVGAAAYEDLRSQGAEVVVIEGDPTAAAEAREEDVLVVEGDATHNSVLEQAGVERANGIIACVSSDSENLVIVLSARSLNPALSVVARANESESESKLLLAGADRVVAPQRVGARRMAAMALQPDLTDFVDLVIRGRHLEFRVKRLEVPTGSPIEGASLREAAIRERSGAMVLAVERSASDVVLNPDPDEVLRAGHKLVTIGSPIQIAQLNALIAVRSPSR